MNLNHIAVFLAVAEARSFSKAAERLRLDKGHVSRVLQSLEHALDTRLFDRTSRSVELTSAGIELVAQVAEPLAALERAGRSLLDRPLTPSGWVTLTTTPDIGRMLVAPALGAFRARFPAPEETLRGAPLYLVCRHDRLLAPSTRALRDHLSATIPTALKQA